MHTFRSIRSRIPFMCKGSPTSRANRPLSPHPAFHLAICSNAVKFGHRCMHQIECACSPSRGLYERPMVVSARPRATPGPSPALQVLRPAAPPALQVEGSHQAFWPAQSGTRIQWRDCLLHTKHCGHSPDREVPPGNRSISFPRVRLFRVSHARGRSREGR